MKTLIVCCLLIASGLSAKLPDYFVKCKKGPGNEKCVADNGNAAIKALSKDGDSKFKLQHLNPIHVDLIDLQATPQLKVVLKNVDFFGFDTSLKFFTGEITEDKLVLHGHMDRMELTANYDINGRILILPIKGDGTCNITMVDADVDIIFKFKPEERKGKKYLSLESESTELKMNNMKRVYWQFDNLFGGDERLGPEMNKFLNDNWQDVFQEVKASMEQTAAFSIFNYFTNGYLRQIPLDDLFDES